MVGGWVSIFLNNFSVAGVCLFYYRPPVQVFYTSGSVFCFILLKAFNILTIRTYKSKRIDALAARMALSYTNELVYG
jgi:hypothetical protein